jgi:hypothetical protein
MKVSFMKRHRSLGNENSLRDPSASGHLRLDRASRKSGRFPYVPKAEAVQSMINPSLQH